MTDENAAGPKEIEEKLETIPVVRNIARGLKTVKLPWLEGLTLYELLEKLGLGKGESEAKDSADSATG